METFPDFDLPGLISTLEKGEKICESNVIKLLTTISQQLFLESNILLLNSPIVVVGDIHGQLDDLLYMFEIAEDKKDQRYIFMGDYVDRGYHSLNTFLLLVAKKLLYPGMYSLLRGNHETRNVSHLYGFYNECLVLYGNSGVWTLCNEVFDLLPMAAIIDGNVLCVHGGLSPNLPLLEMINSNYRRGELQTDTPLSDLCWSDPSEEINRWLKNTRGAGFMFGEEQTKEFLRNNDLQLVIRSHQLAMEGYRWFFENRLVIVWSAPNYSYRSKNKASIMKYGFDGSDPCKLMTYDAAPNRILPKEETAAMPYFS